MFPIQMILTVHNSEQMSAVVSALVSAGALQFKERTAGAKPEPKQEAKKPDPKPQAAATETPAATPSTAAATAAPETKAEPSAGKTIDDAKALTMKIVASKGRDAAVELLKKYGVPVAAKLAADQVTAFCADAEQVLAS